MWAESVVRIPIPCENRQWPEVCIGMDLRKVVAKLKDCDWDTFSTIC